MSNTSAYNSPINEYNRFLERVEHSNTNLFNNVNLKRMMKLQNIPMCQFKECCNSHNQIRLLFNNLTGYIVIRLHFYLDNDVNY